ncbi:MAG: hypothetical protein ACRDL7_12905 [Gaiellaceae bacterium]
MHTFWLIALAVVGVGLAVSWLAPRSLSSRRGAEVRLATDLALHLLVVAILIWSTERAAARGGWFIALALVLALTAAMGAVLSLLRAGALWMSLTGRFSEPDYE